MNCSSLVSRRQVIRTIAIFVAVALVALLLPPLLTNTSAIGHYSAIRQGPTAFDVDGSTYAFAVREAAGHKQVLIWLVSRMRPSVHQNADRSLSRLSWWSMVSEEVDHQLRAKPDAIVVDCAGFPLPYTYAITLWSESPSGWVPTESPINGSCWIVSTTATNTQSLRDALTRSLRTPFGVNLPRLAMVVLLAASPLIGTRFMVAAAIRARRRHQGRCVKCGYQLERGPAVRCPECGDASHASMAKVGMAQSLD